MQRASDCCELVLRGGRFWHLLRLRIRGVAVRAWVARKKTALAVFRKTASAVFLIAMFYTGKQQF